MGDAATRRPSSPAPSLPLTGAAWATTPLLGTFADAAVERAFWEQECERAAASDVVTAATLAGLFAFALVIGRRDTL